MKRSLTAVLMVAALAGAAVLADDPTPLEPGARGTLLTTLEGIEPAEIPVRFLGTVYDFFPGHDVHLVELEGPEAQRVGAANGMSGSPVYFDGRLVGALAYRLGSLPKTPIAGITPIEDMLDASRVARSPAADDAAMHPIGTPVSVGGLAPVLRDWVRPRLEELGFVAVSGGGTGSAEIVGAEIAPGAPVGVALVRGDLRVAASGTVTRVDGDAVYAFGHPFLGTGRVEMPMARAEVVHTLADMAGSFHMVNLGPSVGAFVEDRQSAIVGRLGRIARTIPVEVRVDGGDYGEQDFRFEVVSNSDLTPLLAAVATANSLFLSNGYSDKATILARGSLRLKGLPELPMEMAFSSSEGSDPSIGVAGSLLGTLQGLWINPFDPIEVEGLRLTLEVRTEPVSYRIESLHYDRGPLAPGETLGVRCVLRGHRGGRLTRTIDLRLPERLPRTGSLTLAVSSPAGINGVLGDPLSRRLNSAVDLRGVIEALTEQRSAHRLTAVVYESRGTVISDGVSYSELPPTAERLLKLQAPPGDRKSAALRSPLGRGEVELDGPVVNGLQLRLRIERGILMEEER